MKGLQSMFIVVCFCLFSTTIWAQKRVSGTVKTPSGEELIGVTIILKNDQSKGTITDFDGSFVMDIPGEDAILVFSYTGYETQEIQAVAGEDINVILGEDVASLNEVVVVGYGVEKKAITTAAISKVDSEKLKDLPIQRVEEALKGRVGGLIITANSGQPGSASTVRIRGTTTIGNSDPLYVVDGVPIGGGIDYLSSSDIESIEVLKDASGSIYGARAANGVILITTKKGKKNTMSVNYSGYYGVQNPWRKLRLLNATEYATLINESRAAAGESIIYDDPQSLGEGTDWQDAVFNEDASIQEHTISISAGSEKSTYFSSIGFYDQLGIVAPEDSRFRRFNVRFNSTHEITNKFSFGNTLAYTRTNSRTVSENSEFGSPLGRAINIDPITPVYETDPEVLNSSVFTNFPVVSDETGIFGISDRVTSEIVNPVAALEVNEGLGWSDKVVGNIFGEFEIIEGLKIRSSFGADIAFWGGEGFTPIHYLNSSNQVTQTSYNRNKNRGLAWNWDNTISYSKRINGHSFTILGGTTAFSNSGEGDFGTLNNIPVSSLEEASAGFFTPVEDNSFGGFEYEDKLISYFSRLNYNFQEKYLATVIYRIDGSSRFLETNRFAQFPSVSLGWVLTEEPFLQGNPIVNFLKVRGSWGINGNNHIDNNQFLATVGTGRTYTFGDGEILIDGVSPNAASNPNLQWEEVVQTNIGFDSKIFRKVALTIDFFKKETRGMLLGIEVPDFTGVAGPTANVGTMENRGVELELGFNRSFGEVDVNLSGNVTYLENEITFLTNDREFLAGQRFGPQGLEITRTQVGQPIGFLFGFETDGLFQNQAEIDAYTNQEGGLLQPDAGPGDIRFIDFNNDGIINEEDRTIIGDPTPSWTYGMTLNLNYKNFELAIFGQGVAGNEVFNATRRFDLPTANYQADALGRWTGEGTSNDFPRLISSDPNKNFSTSSDFFVESGAYFRIKNLRLGYRLPFDVLDKVGMKKAFIYVSANNFLTFTQYKGFDPEIGGGSFGVDRGLYPQARSFLVGANVGF